MSSGSDYEYRFDCGCKFKALSQRVKDCDGLPPLDIDLYNLPYCSSAWSDVGMGKVKGVFQVEKHLGKKWCSEIKPMNTEELSAIISIIRPGVLENMIDNKSLTKHYADRKNNIEEAIPIHPLLEPILNETQQIIIYQEQIIKISIVIAGFSGVEADTLRRGIGHKDPAIISSLEKKFVEGCVKTSNMDEKDAQQIFDIIRKSQRYLFNKSHSIEYAKLGEISASLKYHFPLHFFAAYLAYANEKLDPKQEVKEVINDARNYEVIVNPPHIQNIFDDKEGGIILKENEILFGLIDIKGIGLNHIKQLYSKIEETQKKIRKPISNWSWLDLLVNIDVNSTVMENLILIGATCGGEARRRKAFEYSIFKKLTDRDLIWIKNNYIRYKSFSEILSNYVETDRSNGGPATEKRRTLLREYAETLKNPPYDLSDNPDWIVSNERQLIGIPLSYASTETKSIATNMNVADFLAGKNGKITLLVEIEDSKDFTIKNGKNAGMKMAFMKVKDSSGIADACIFSEGFQKHSECIYDGNVVLISATRSTRDKNSLIINSMEQV